MFFLNSLSPVLSERDGSEGREGYTGAKRRGFKREGFASGAIVCWSKQAWSSMEHCCVTQILTAIAWFFGDLKGCRVLGRMFPPHAHSTMKQPPGARDARAYADTSEWTRSDRADRVYHQPSLPNSPSSSSSPSSSLASFLPLPPAFPPPVFPDLPAFF